VGTVLATLLTIAAAVGLPGGDAIVAPIQQTVSPGSCERMPRMSWPDSQSLGLPNKGRLVNGVNLPMSGCGFKTYDPITFRIPSRSWRRWGTDDTVRMTIRIMIDDARRNPGATPVLIGDLSRPRGGDFGRQYGFVGHASHQNGRDIDVYYPRRDGALDTPKTPGEVDLKRAQQLVDAFVDAGAEKVFVGPSLPLRGPKSIVVRLAGHDNHLHARFPAD
jgi:murein endopeptidase